VKTAVLKEEQFLTDAEGKRVGVLLDLRAYERLSEAEEELADSPLCARKSLWASLRRWRNIA
jgi:hypothetical protein